MTKNERIAELEREVAELKKRPQVTYVFPIETLRPFPAYQLPTYRPQYWQPWVSYGTTTVSSHPDVATQWLSGVNCTGLAHLWGSENPGHANYIAAGAA